MRSAKFDKIAIGEMTVNFMVMPTTMRAKAAFVNAQTGETHGWTECSNWSEDTYQKMRDLRTCMERDLERLHFEESSTTGSGGNQIAHDGLGEALGHVPQG